MMFIFAKIFFVQVLVAAVVIAVLKKILDRQLIDLAVKKFDITKPTDADKNLSALIVISFCPVPPRAKQKIERLAQQKFNRSVPVVVKIDRSLRAGMIIKLESAQIDYSLIGRLKEGGIIR